MVGLLIGLGMPRAGLAGGGAARRRGGEGRGRARAAREDWRGREAEGGGSAR
jgi:hypothetical protein